MQHDLPPQDALALIFEHLAPFSPDQPRATESLPLLDALGRVLARDAASPLHLPPFDNSSVDGYAVRSPDIAGATEDAPITLPCALTIAAAQSKGETMLKAGECARIMTGAPVPAGADAIVMREDVDESDTARIVFAAITCAGQSIRRRGEDIARGEVAVAAGTHLRPSEIALLAACGLGEVEVARRPRVAIITTGDELVEPGQELQAGQIYNSNAVSLGALCNECGASIVSTQHVGDDAGALAHILENAARECDVIVTSGGVSAGDFDPVRDALLGTAQQPASARAHLWKAAIKPGRPILFATRQEDESGCSVPIFALPGNPVSVAVTFELFVRPALLALQGASFARRCVRARVDTDGASPVGKTEFVRAFVRPEAGGGAWQAEVTGAQGSGRLTTMARANALLVIPPSVGRYRVGDEFEARLLD